MILIAALILLTGCAHVSDISFLPEAARPTVIGANIIEMIGDSATIRTGVARELSVRGFTLMPSPEASVLQAEGATSEDGEVVYRISFVLTETGATGRAWWKHGNGPVSVALKNVGIPVSDAYQPAEWGRTMSGDRAFSELAHVASSVPGVEVRSGRR